MNGHLRVNINIMNIMNKDILFNIMNKEVFIPIFVNIKYFFAEFDRLDYYTLYRYRYFLLLF